MVYCQLTTGLCLRYADAIGLAAKNSEAASQTEIRIFFGDKAMTFDIVKPDYITELLELAMPSVVSSDHVIKDADDVNSFTISAHNRQAMLILQNVMAEAHASLMSATAVVSRRGIATPDPFLRYHLLAAAREVAAISGVLEASLWVSEPGPPCFVRTLASEVSRLESLYTERVGPIERCKVALNFVPSWTSEIIFRLLVRALIYDAFVHAPHKAKFSLRLQRDGEVLRFGIDGSGLCSEHALMSRIDHPKNLKLLLASLSAHLKSAPNGISVCIPVTACMPLEPGEDVTWLWA
jgi:hypothetical protein